MLGIRCLVDAEKPPDDVWEFMLNPIEDGITRLIERDHVSSPAGLRVALCSLKQTCKMLWTVLKLKTRASLGALREERPTARAHNG